MDNGANGELDGGLVTQRPGAVGQLWDGADADASERAAIDAAQVALLGDELPLDTVERLFVRALQRHEYSEIAYLVVGENATVIDWPEPVKQGVWKLVSIFAVADANDAADVTVRIAGLIPGIEVAIVAPKAALGADELATPVGMLLDRDMSNVTVRATGTNADKACVIFNLAKVR